MDYKKYTIRSMNKEGNSMSINEIMTRSGDLTFITNEANNKLKDRFSIIAKSTRLFDCIVGYFFSSGFSQIYHSLEHIEKVRILVGINTDQNINAMFNEGRNLEQIELYPSHAETKEMMGKRIEKEYEDSSDDESVEAGTLRFIEWIKNGKLEIRAYPTNNLHAKVYIFGFHDDSMDTGRVITGSSNLTQAGLEDNIEFNVELKNSSDYTFAKSKFEELWKDAVELNDRYVDVIKQKTWINNTITPYELYLKTLYEYFKKELNQTDEVYARYRPKNFMDLEYQKQAVVNARRILDEYGGVFISDVVGLGKTYIATLLAGQLDGRTLVIAPPLLLREDNPGSWNNAFSDFGIPADFKSLGKLDDLVINGTEKYSNIIIDEAHRFRTEMTATYEKLSEICRGKRIILVTATPYNNSPWDLLSLIKLFQSPKRSTIPNLPNLEAFFTRLGTELKKLNRKNDFSEVTKITKKNAKEIREKVLKYLMVRRTRTEIIKYFQKDLKLQGLRFPEVVAPRSLYYQLNEVEDRVFNESIELISKKLKYTRYTPLLYLSEDIGELEKQSQKNLATFMKILLIKRLESSFFAFRKSLERFRNSYVQFINEYESGYIYLSKKDTNKILEYVEIGDDESIQRLISEGRAEKLPSSSFNPKFIDDLRADLDVLNEVSEIWKSVTRDPKMLAFTEYIAKDQLLKSAKVVVFTESKETAEYITVEVNNRLKEKALCYTGGANQSEREQVISNFDAKAKIMKNDYRLLVATEVLSEGINLHQANVVINYDIPWNPTRMMQRIGRINRIDTKHDQIFTYNFFPTKQANDVIALEEAAKAKIDAFFTLLGADSAILTEGEPIGSHELFGQLTSKKPLTYGEDENEVSELKYLSVIKEIREKKPELFERIKRIPLKARSGKSFNSDESRLISFIKKGEIQKFFAVYRTSAATELDFLAAASQLESQSNENRIDLPNDYFRLLSQNKEAFKASVLEEKTKERKVNPHDNLIKLIRIIKIISHDQKLTDDQETYLDNLLSKLEQGMIPKPTMKNAVKALKELNSDVQNPLKVIGILKTKISERFLTAHAVDQNTNRTSKSEIVLSMYLDRKSK